MAVEKYLICWILLFALLSSASAQTSYNIPAGQGLSTNQLTVLVKDSKNNIWFGSYNGLHKNKGTSAKYHCYTGCQ